MTYRPVGRETFALPPESVLEPSLSRCIETVAREEFRRGVQTLAAREGDEALAEGLRFRSSSNEAPSAGGWTCSSGRHQPGGAYREKEGGWTESSPLFGNAREAHYYNPVPVCAMPPGVELSDGPGIGPGPRPPGGQPRRKKPDWSLTIWSMLLSVCV